MYNSQGKILSFLFKSINDVGNDIIKLILIWNRPNLKIYLLTSTKQNIVEYVKIEQLRTHLNTDSSITWIIDR